MGTGSPIRSLGHLALMSTPCSDELKNDYPQSPFAVVTELGRFPGQSAGDATPFGAHVAVVPSSSKYYTHEVDHSIPTLMLADSSVIRTDAELLRSFALAQVQPDSTNPCVLRLLNNLNSK